MLEVRELRDYLQLVSVLEEETRTFEKYSIIKDKIKENVCEWKKLSLYKWQLGSKKTSLGRYIIFI